MNQQCEIISKPSDKLVKLIATFEGFRSEMYKCAAGKETIGFGHLIGDDEVDLRTKILTKEEAMDLLRQDIINRTSLEAINVSLSQHQRDALTSLCFNIGTTNFAKSSVVRHVNSGNLDSAREFFGHWRLASGKVLPGLCMRRLAEVCIFAHESVDPQSSDPPSVQWGRVNAKHAAAAATPPPTAADDIDDMTITDDNWKRMSVENRRRAVTIYEEYWS